MKLIDDYNAARQAIMDHVGCELLPDEYGMLDFGDNLWKSKFGKIVIESDNRIYTFDTFRTRHGSFFKGPELSIVAVLISAGEEFLIILDNAKETKLEGE